MNRLILRKADDMHVHLRQGPLLEQILEQTISQVARALVMPNTAPAIENSRDLKTYRENIIDALRNINKRLGKNYIFQPLMTFKILPNTSVEMVKELKAAGATAGKLYPEGVTTNSENGIKDFRALYPIYEAMSKENLVLCLHGEAPEEFCIDREKEFLPTVKKIAHDFPQLKIVLEHLSTAEAVDLVRALPANVAGTITVHHMLTTLDDVIGGPLKPHLFCKPLPKRTSDKESLIQAATSGNPKFFLGSDSAPHAVEKKECDCGAAGVYTAAVLLPLLAQLFQDKNKLEKLEDFTSKFGAEFYNLPLNYETIELKNEPWVVPKQLHGVVPFMAGQTINWQVTK